MLEGPLFHATIGRLADPTRNLRAWGLNMQLSLLIESPVIMLLATSIALVRDRPSHAALRRFTLWLCAFCTVVCVLVAFTPLFDFVCRRVLGYPAETADAARLPLQIMTLWSAAIGWRRFNQGLVIRSGQSRLVTLGTVGRLGSMAVACALLAATGSVPGAVAASAAMMVGVVTEAFLSDRFARPVVRTALSGDGPDLPLSAILRFHMPLAVTTLMGLSAQPIVSASLAALPDRERTLAAWPVVFSLLLVLRGFGLAVQEATVSRLRTRSAEPELLFVFALLIGAATTGATLLVAWDPVLRVVASGLSLPADLLDRVAEGLRVGALLPLLTAVGSWARGVLTAHGRTVAVTVAMVAGLIAQGALLWFGVRHGVNPMRLAAVAIHGAEVAGLAVAVLGLRRLPAETD